MQVKVRTQQVNAAVATQKVASRARSRTMQNTVGATALARALAMPRILQNIPLLKSAVVLFTISLFLYLYMVVSIVVATVDRKSLEEKIRSESTELTYKETEYSKRISSITLATVYAEGYIDSGEQAFAKRATAPTLTLANE